MSLDNRFRIGELTQSGSRAVVSQDTTSKSHTFISDSKTIVLGEEDGGNAPYTHVKGDRDGELTAYVEKPAYKEDQLKKAVDTVIDELVLPPKKDQPDVVPREVYDELEDKFQQALTDLENAQLRISELEADLATERAISKALQMENDSLKVQKAIVDNQFQQSIDRYRDVTAKLTTAVLKGTKEANQRVRLNAEAEGLIAQKDGLRQQLLSLRRIIVGLTDAAKVTQEQMLIQQENAKAQAALAKELADQQKASLEAQQEALESQLSGQAAETQAAAAGMISLSDSQSYYKVKKITSPTAPEDLSWTTSARTRKPGKTGTLVVQNLKDTGAKIIKVEISFPGMTWFSSYGPLGFDTDNGPPKKTKAISVEQGATKEITLYFNKKIGGTNKPEPNKWEWWSGDSKKDYRDPFKFKFTYDDGTTASTDNLNYYIRKNKE